MTIPSDSMEQKAREKSLELWQATTNTPDPYSDSDWLVIDEMEKALISFAAAQVAEAVEKERKRCMNLFEKELAHVGFHLTTDILNPAPPATEGDVK